MGARGREAHVVARAPHKNSRPHATAPGRVVEEAGARFWDLADGDRRPSPNPLAPERRRAWRAWRGRLERRWPPANGERLAAWHSFEAPRLLAALVRAGVITEADAVSMSDAEAVWWVTDPGERAAIEENWREAITNAR